MFLIITPLTEQLLRRMKMFKISNLFSSYLYNTYRGATRSQSHISNVSFCLVYSLYSKLQGYANSKDHKRWDFRDDCTEYIYSFMVLSSYKLVSFFLKYSHLYLYISNILIYIYISPIFSFISIYLQYSH